MMKVYCCEKALVKGLEELSGQLGFILCNEELDADINIKAIKGEKTFVRRERKICTVSYDKLSRFYSVFSRILENIDHSLYGFNPDYICGDLGVMLDCSRNAVPNTQALKHIIRQLALMGYNYLELYTEDTYKIEGEPLFGYLKGAYTVNEIKEIAEYGKLFGIELVPCIQTLAHLEGIFRYGAYQEINDIDNILLLEEERTYQLIENMFIAARKAYDTDRINLGLDEAHNLGRGKFFDKHGFKDRFVLMSEHINFLLKMCEKYGFTKPSMWCDMFFRLKFGDFYTKEKTDFEKEIRDMVPKGIRLLYWDYYNEDISLIKNMLRLTCQLNDDIGFAGGAWKWSGFAPINSKSERVNKLAIEACIENKIKDVLITAWGDNGAECSFYSILPTLLHTAILCENGGQINDLESRSKFLFGYNHQEFIKLDLPNELYSKGENKTVNPSKYLFYNDPLLGLFDKNVDEYYDEKYKTIFKTLFKLSKRNSPYSYLFKTMAKLSKVLILKNSLGCKIKKYYDAADKEGLLSCIKDIDVIIKDIGKLYDSLLIQWEKENKSFGFEIQDIRIGGLIYRLKHVKKIIFEYIDDKRKSIDELNEERIRIIGYNNLTLYNNWVKNVSANKL